MKYALALCALLFAVPAYAKTYLYTGGVFDAVYYERGPTSPTYDFVGPPTADRMTITLKDNVATLTVGQFTGTVTSPYIEKDADGQIVGWDIVFADGPTNTLMLYSRLGYDVIDYKYEYQYPCVPGGCVSAEYVSAKAVAGTWEEVTPVPLSSSGLFLGSILLAGLYYSRRPAASLPEEGRTALRRTS